jgi:hypothetical protein
MNKIDIRVIIALTISGLLLLPSLSSASSISNVTFSATGVVQYSASGPSTPINKAVYVYGLGWTDADTSFVADHFTLLDADFDGCRTDFYIPYLQAMQSIKAKNPNVKIIGYKDFMGMYTYLDDWAEANSHEDWFIHDANGNRIKNTQWGWYLMDCGNAGWRQHLFSYVNGKMNNAAYDGVFADDVWNAITDWSLSAFDKTIPNSVRTRWHNDMKGLLQNVKTNLLTGKILVVNTDEWETQDYINVADGMMIEGYGHAYWEGIDTQGTRSTATILQQIAALSRSSSTGKIVYAASGTIIPSPMNTAKVNAMVKYCYGIFLLGEGGSQAYCGFNDWWSSDGSHGYYPIMDTQIGSPIGDFYSSQNVYMRDFSGGKVVVNLASSSYTVNLGGTYKLLDGTPVSIVTLNPYSGEILLSPT